MRILRVLASVVLAFGVLVGTIWATRYAPWVKPHERKKDRWEIALEQAPVSVAKKAKEAREQEQKGPTTPSHANNGDEPAEKPPAISDKPPYPRVVTGERVFGFDSMAVDESKSHKFRIENKGEAPLVIAKGPTTCKCTISKVSSQGIPAGGFADIELTWTPREASPSFEQTATIWTNDPQEQEFKFKVFGKVVKLFQVVPEHTWHASHVTDIEDGKFVGRIASSLDRNFEIVSLQPSHPAVSATFKRVGPRELSRDGYLQGYDVDVRVGKGIPRGAFRSRLKINTTLEGNKVIDVEVTATRSGPILFLPPIGKRVGWSADRSLLTLGRFDHADGKKATLPALIYGLKEDFKILKVKSSLDFVKVSLEPNPEMGSGADQKGYKFVFEVTPGSPPVMRMSPNDVELNLETNHPRMKDMIFHLDFVSQ